MDINYFKEYYTLERSHWWFTARKNILESQIHKLVTTSSLKILNIGVATGSTSEMLSKYGEVTSVEFDHECCEFLRSELKMEVIEGSITELPFQSHTFDLICAFDVVEHVEDHEKAVLEMKRVCKSQGTVFCTVPAFSFLWSQHDDVNHHIRRYTGREFSTLFSNSGKITYSTYFNFFLFLPVACFRLFSRILPFAIKRKGAGSDFTLNGSAIFSNLFYKIFNSENVLLQRQYSLPFGISYLLIWKKN
ncbi:MAG: class I SAM-dependent methyltransferase [Bacteroidetes bacterium]|nr:class I SAM-dependent methyltransferase [Bacteroidota bacterium]